MGKVKFRKGQAPLFNQWSIASKKREKKRKTKPRNKNHNNKL